MEEKARASTQIALLFYALFLFSILSFMISSMISSVAAEGFDVKVTPIKTIITETQPALLSVDITNLATTETFEVFTLQTAFIFPTKILTIASGETKTIQLEIYPQIKQSGFYEFVFFVKSQHTGEIKQLNEQIRLLTLEDALHFSVEPETLSVSSTKLTLVVINVADISVENARIEASSQIFQETFETLIKTKEELRFDVAIDVSKAEGGRHNITVKFYDSGTLAFVEDVPYKIERIYDFTQSKSVSGFLVRQTIVKFENKGNTREALTYEEAVTFPEKVFSYFSQKPEFKTDEEGLKAKFGITVEPYVTKELLIKTNYLLPLIVLILIIIGFSLTTYYQSRHILVSKYATRAKSTRGSAFKVTIRVKNRKDAIRDVTIRDFLPKGLKIYEKFDLAKPHNVADNYVEWRFKLMHGGEERVVTYYIYNEQDIPHSLVLPGPSVQFYTLHRESMAESGNSFTVPPLSTIKVRPMSAGSASTAAHAAAAGAKR